MVSTETKGSFITTTQDNSRLTIGVTGILSAKVHREFVAAYKHVTGVDEYIIDMVNTEFVDSSGLGLLLSLYADKRVKQMSKGKIKIINTNADIQKILLIGKLNRFFEIA